MSYTPILMDLVLQLCINQVQNLLDTQAECSSIHFLLHAGAIWVQYWLDINWRAQNHSEL